MCKYVCSHYFSHCYNKLSDKRNLREEGQLTVPALRKHTVQCGGKLGSKSLRWLVMLTSRSGGSRDVNSSMCPTFFSFLSYWFRTPTFGVVSPTFRVPIPSSLFPLVLLPFFLAPHPLFHYSLPVLPPPFR